MFHALVVRALLPAVALIPCLAGAAPAVAPLPGPATAAWQQAMSRLGRPAPDLASAVATALGDLPRLEIAALGTPAGRAALAAELAAAGLTPQEQAALVPSLLDAARQSAAARAPWVEPLVSIGPFELTVTQLAEVAGPREGRDRDDVVLRLRHVAPAVASGLNHEDLVALVPQVVEAAESASVTRALARLRAVLLPEEDQ